MKITDNDIRILNDKGILRSVNDSYSLPNIGLPNGILAQMSSEVIEAIFAKRSGEEVAGNRKKVIDWADEAYFQPSLETTGQTTPYGDFAQVKVVGINPNFEQYGHYRFSARMTIGSLEEEQLAKAKINVFDRKMGAVMEALEIEANRTAFNGFIDNTSGKFLVYGLLNNPTLPNWTASAKTFDNMTYAEIMAFFAGAISQLTTQTGNNINVNSKIRVAIASNKFAYLSGLVTEFGYSALDGLRKAYPNMEFISVYEFEKAYNNQDCIYFIGESMAGGVADTLYLGYSELARQSNLVIQEEFRSQQVSSGTIGAIINKPLFVLRYNNI